MSLLALIHIGSSSVSGGLIENKKLIFATERQCRFQDKLDQDEFLVNITEALKQVMKDLISAKLGLPTKCLVFLSSPFVAGQLNLIRQTADKPFAVTEKLVANLIAKDAEQFKDDPKHVVLDSKIMNFVLNGYSVSEPHGQKVTNLEISHYLSIGASTVVDKFRQIIVSACQYRQVEFYAAGFANFIVGRDLKPTSSSFLLLDIGGEITELTMVHGGVLRETLSYPLGQHALLREVVFKRDSGAEEVRSALSLGAVSDTHLADTQGEWLRYFKTGLAKILQNRFWSGEILLLTEEENLATQFANWLQEAALDQIFFGKHKIVITLLNRELLTPLVTLGPKVRPSLSLLAMSAFVLK